MTYSLHTLIIFKVHLVFFLLQIYSNSFKQINHYHQANRNKDNYGVSSQDCDLFSFLLYASSGASPHTNQQ